MWPNLETEMDALKRERYGERYRVFRDRLRQAGTKIPWEKKREYLEIENSFLYLISYMTARYEGDGWGKGGVFQELLTSHMLRLLSGMKVSLTARWKLASQQEGERSRQPGGNLYRSSAELISAYHPPDGVRYAMWGTDFWDDCYILLSLIMVRGELHDLNHVLEAEFAFKYQKSLDWLRQQVADEFRAVCHVPSEWFGPGFHAAAIELFDYLHRGRQIKDGEQLIAAVAKNIVPHLEQAVRKEPLSWDKNFAWNAGQLIVAWKEKRKDASNPQGYESLRELDPLAEKLYEVLKERQCRNGSWPADKNLVNIYYNTVRGLAACYVMERDTEKGLLASQEIERAHRYLLKETHQARPLSGDDKACVNAIEAFQKLFEFTIPDIHFYLLVSLSYRLHCLGLEKTIISPPPQDEDGLLRTVRQVAKEKLENRGQTAIETLGINGRLYDYLSKQPQFLNEFNETDQQKVRDGLKSFLSSTMTEVRSTEARSLIRELWSREGLLNFLPLVTHLSDLEHERAFYKFYRDHLNHEVLLFLLGSYIYYQNKNFRESINEEIRGTYKYYKVKPPDKIEEEFLFRWKLIATFHDIGYLFEVDPSEEEYPARAQRLKEKERMLKKSFGVIDAVRQNFLQEYFGQYAKDDGGGAGLASDVAAIKGRLKNYLPKISKPEHLFTLKTGGRGNNAFEMMDRMLNLGDEPGHIAPGLLKNYFDLCRENDSKGSFERDRFYDHGIMSALILLKVADVQRHYLRQLRDLGFRSPREFQRYPKLLDQLMKDSTDRDLNEERFYIRFSHVAGAIALHNVYPGLYSQAQCEAFDTSRRLAADKGLAYAFHTAPPKAKDRYGISLDENPMAYLTALADLLQDWDRHSFRRPSFEGDKKPPISSSEVLINCDNGKIQVTPLSELASKRYVDYREGMEDYLLNCKEHVQVSPFKGFSDGQPCPVVGRGTP